MLDEQLKEMIDWNPLGKVPNFEIGNEDVLRCEDWVCVPNDEELTIRILDKRSRARLPYPHLKLAGMVLCPGYGDITSTRV